MKERVKEPALTRATWGPAVKITRHKEMRVDGRRRHNIKSVGLPPKKIPSFLWPVKDDIGLKTTGVYSVPCKCGQVYISQTSCSIKTRVKELISMDVPAGCGAGAP
jgi:hypothetical protein